MKKITVDKNEGIAEVIDRVLAASDADVVLVVPKGSVLAKSASNFRLLKREAGLAEKKIAIESIDDEIIQLAEASGIGNHAAAKHFQHGVGVSDIVAKVDARDGGEDDDSEQSAAARHAKKQAAIKLTVHAESEESEAEDKQSSFARDRFFQPRAVPLTRRGEDDNDSDDD